MGRPKPLVAFCGAPLVCRARKRLHKIADEMIITSNDPQSLDFIHCCTAIPDQPTRIVTDILPERSALGGIYTALHYAQYEYVAIVACDMVFPSAPLLKGELSLLEAQHADIAVPWSKHGYEPFHAVYRKATCEGVVERHLAYGDQRATAFYEEMNVIKVTPPEVLQFEPRGGAFINVNRPEELIDMERRVWTRHMHKLTD
jgi:molybdopterin-guanine dinucleotide biosynthesis protein A